jgi:ribosome maturation factor RimP
MPTWPLEEIRQLLQPTLEHMGYSIYELSQAGDNGGTLELVIDKHDGFVSLDDCARVTRVSSPLIEQADLIPDSYVLQVSSPGAERPLRERLEYQRFLGQTVNVRYGAGESEVVVEGKLETVGEDGIEVRGRRGEATHVDWPSIVKARLVATL